MNSNGYFDTKAFMDALDKVRQERQLSWYQVGNEIDAQTGFLTEMLKGKRTGMNVHTLATLCLWSGLDPHPYMKKRHEEEV